MYHICLSIHLLMHVRLFLHLGLMRITLLKTLIQISESLLPVLLGKCPKVILGHKVVSFSEKTPYCFPQHLHHFIFPPAMHMHKGSSVSTSSPYLRFSLLYTMVTVASVKRYFIMAQICIFLMISDIVALYVFVYDVSLHLFVFFFLFQSSFYNDFVINIFFWNKQISCSTLQAKLF